MHGKVALRYALVGIAERFEATRHVPGLKQQADEVAELDVDESFGL